MSKRKNAEKNGNFRSGPERAVFLTLSKIKESKKINWLICSWVITVAYFENLISRSPLLKFGDTFCAWFDQQKK